MSLARVTPLVLLLLSGCTSPKPVIQAPRPPVAVYRLDFAFAMGESKTTFSVNVADNDSGEVVLGKNVPLTSSNGAPSPRQDVGLKVITHLRQSGDDVLLDVGLEMSSFDPPSIRKMTARGSALVSMGKPAVVTSLDDDQRKYELTVTPTKLR